MGFELAYYKCMCVCLHEVFVCVSIGLYVSSSVGCTGRGRIRVVALVLWVLFCRLFVNNAALPCTVLCGVGKLMCIRNVVR